MRARRTQTISIPLNEHIEMCGDVETIDDSFDHEFGTEESAHYHLKEFNVIMYVNGNDYDITKGLDEEDLEKFKLKFLEKITG